MSNTPSIEPAFVRILDGFIALAALAFLLPTLVVVAAGLRISRRGPIVSRQACVGEDGRPFLLLGFALSPDGGNALERLMVLARLDTLPRLWNVARGDLSLVGPPPRLDSAAEGDDRRKASGPRSGLVWPFEQSKPLTVRRYVTGLAGGLALIFTNDS